MSSFFTSIIIKLIEVLVYLGVCALTYKPESRGCAVADQILDPVDVIIYRIMNLCSSFIGNDEGNANLFAFFKKCIDNNLSTVSIDFDNAKPCFSNYMIVAALLLKKR